MVGSFDKKLQRITSFAPVALAVALLRRVVDLLMEMHINIGETND